MKPGLSKDSAVFVLPFTLGIPDFFTVKNLKRGDVVRVGSYEKDDSNFFIKAARLSVTALTFRRMHIFKTSPSGQVADGLFRLVGFPGDTVYIKDYIAYIKEAGGTHFLTEFELSEIDYNIFIDDLPEAWDKTMGVQGNVSSFTLAEDEYFVLCDNRISAFDSRLFGAVKADSINGKALFQYFPFAAVKKLY